MNCSICNKYENLPNLKICSVCDNKFSSIKGEEEICLRCGKILCEEEMRLCDNCFSER